MALARIVRNLEADRDHKKKEVVAKELAVKEKQQKLSELKVRNMTAKNEVTMMKQHLRYTSEVNEALESSIRSEKTTIMELEKLAAAMFHQNMLLAEKGRKEREALDRDCREMQQGVQQQVSNYQGLPKSQVLARLEVENSRLKQLMKVVNMKEENIERGLGVGRLIPPRTETNVETSLPITLSKDKALDMIGLEETLRKDTLSEPDICVESNEFVVELPRSVTPSEPPESSSPIPSPSDTVVPVKQTNGETLTFAGLVNQPAFGAVLPQTEIEPIFVQVPTPKPVRDIGAESKFKAPLDIERSSPQIRPAKTSIVAASKQLKLPVIAAPVMPPPSDVNNTFFGGFGEFQAREEPAGSLFFTGMFGRSSPANSSGSGTGSGDSDGFGGFFGGFKEVNEDAGNKKKKANGGFSLF